MKWGSNLISDRPDMNSQTFMTQAIKMFGLNNELEQKCSLPISIHSHFNIILVTMPLFIVYHFTI
jgi:hypothetical protein